jgi:hypothetical protein
MCAFELGLELASLVQLAFQLACTPCNSRVHDQDAGDRADDRSHEQSKDGEFERRHGAIKAHPSRVQGVT